MSARVRESIAEEAAEWFVANRAGTRDAVQRASFAAWLKSSPLHVEEYLGVALVAQDLRQAADPGVSLDELLAEARRADETNVRSVGADSARLAARFPRARWRFAAVAATLAAAALLVLWWSADRAVAVRYATRHGELITQRLSDGSTIHLDTDSVVAVRYGWAQRLVEIERGQAFFEVAHEAIRPFRVRAGYAIAQAVGTRFGVYRRPDSTAVTVVEGQVAVGLAPGELGADAAAGRTVRVSAGQRLEVARGSLPAAATPADTQRATAWLRREIVFEQEPLAAVAAEFSRYSAAPIEIETPELGALPISGVFAIDDAESFVAFLRSLEGVKVEITPSRVRVSRM